MELKLSSSNNTRIVSLYVVKWDKKAHPNGLIRGAKVRFHQVQKILSKKSNAYLVTTLFSTYDILEVNPFLDQSNHLVYQQPKTFLCDMSER